MENDEPSTSGLVAVVIPSLSSVLGNGTDSDVYISPLTVPHFLSDCHVGSPNFDFPFPVTALIDNGSHTVLIDKTLVDQLGL